MCYYIFTYSSVHYEYIVSTEAKNPIIYKIHGRQKVRSKSMMDTMSALIHLTTPHWSLRIINKSQPGENINLIQYLTVWGRGGVESRYQVRGEISNIKQEGVGWWSVSHVPAPGIMSWRNGTDQPRGTVQLPGRCINHHTGQRTGGSVTMSISQYITTI